MREKDIVDFSNEDRQSLFLQREKEVAKRKALESLARYKFQMFGYWAAIWVHLNKISEANEPNPFRELVKLAKKLSKERTECL